MLSYTMRQGEYLLCGVISECLETMCTIMLCGRVAICFWTVFTGEGVSEADLGCNVRLLCSKY